MFNNDANNCLCGFVNILKPQGMTSSDVVVKVRGLLSRALGQKIKVGHLGTLDPLATGVLPIAIGKATRLFDYLTFKQKTYEAAFLFGETTDTLDRAGEIIEKGGRVPSKDEILSVLPDMIGDIMQIPPQYSSKSVDGKRAYQYARSGQTVELQPKSVRIDAINMIGDSADLPDSKSKVYEFEIVCGGGTYIRAIARDMAEKLGTFAYMTALNRTKSGFFTEADAVTLNEFASAPLEHIIDVDTALVGFKSFNIPEEYMDKVLNGVKIKLENMPQNECFAVNNNGKIFGIAENTNGELKIKTRL